VQSFLMSLRGESTDRQSEFPASQPYLLCTITFGFFLGTHTSNFHALS